MCQCLRLAHPRVAAAAAVWQWVALGSYTAALVAVAVAAADLCRDDGDAVGGGAVWLQTRSELTVNGITAAKEVGVGHLVVLSIPIAGVVTTVFGRQLPVYEVERATKTSGLPWTIIQVPLFTENNWYDDDCRTA